MKIARLTDIHLDFLKGHECDKFFKYLKAQEVDAFFLTGDISTGTYIEEHLLLFEQIKKPVYFILGNHDFYGSSVDEVRAKMKAFDFKYLHYLTQSEPQEIQPDVFVLGHDGWADGQGLNLSAIRINDFSRIKDLYLKLGEETPDGRMATLKRLATKSVEHINSCLIQLPPTAKDIYILTHAPLFLEGCDFADQLETINMRPHYLNRILGRFLVDFATHNPEKNITVLCGHIHRAIGKKILSNLSVLSGFAQYRSPAICGFLEI